nr:PAAR-like protein [uncultured Flavobacterium sp.]
MAKGEIIVEGAKCFCSNSVANNSKATAVPLVVKSQSKKLKENKYFAQEKPIATNLDNTAESFNNGEGFGYCYLPDKKKKPCKGQCSIKYKDFYKNVDFDKSMKVLLDISTGTCPGYGVPGTITFATTGQKKAVNTIDVKEADAFTVENTSAHWEISDPTKEDSVTEITIVAPLAEKPTGKYYFIEKAKNTNIWPSSMPVSEAKLQLKAIYKGDPTKITWAIFKGDEVKDKVKTFVGIGANIVFTLGTLFKDLEEGLYRIEAYANKAGFKKCAILIEYIKDHVEGITAPGKTLLKNTPIPLTLKFKATSLVEKQKILNPGSLNPVYETSPIASWRVTCKNTVIFNSQISSESNLIKVETKTGALGIFTFKNPDEYQVEAYTSPNDLSPIKITLKVLESLGVNTVKGTCNQLLRYNESLKVEVSKFNVEFLPTNTTKMQWYLQKDGIRLTAFENAAISKEKSINKPINQILYNDAQGGNNYFGKYAIEGYGKPTNRPLFNASDSFFFEVIRNSIDKVTLPKSIPKGGKVKLETAARIMPLIGDEKINLELPNDVVDNHDGTITFNSEGEFDIAAYLTGEETLDTKVNTKIKVATPELKRALWAYGTGYKRTETGYKEETHAFVEIAGLENQTITIKVWVRGISESFYLEPATYMLEEKKISLNDKGIGSFKITTDDKYKDKIKKARPATTEVPTPIISLIFTVEMPTGSQGTITLPNDMDIKNGKPIVGTKFIEVLDSNEELAVTNEQKIKSIFFAKEDGKGVQQTLTHQAKTHKIWVYTVNMQEEELRVDVMSLVHSDCMEEKNGIITVLQSIQEYKEKVDSDGLLELPFTAEEKYLTDAEANPVRFSIQVSRKVKDPNDDKKEVYVFEDDQLAEMPYPNASLVRSPDMKTVGIKAIKQDETPFSKEEKIALRKQLICFKNTALIVAKGILTEEAIENCTVPVVVDLEMAEVHTNGVCACKENNFYWSSKITCDERKKVLEVCANIWGEENKIEKASMLMAVMHLETGKTFSPSQKGVSSAGAKYIGLVQFSATTAQSLGTTYDALGEMTFIKQLEYVEKYLKQNKDRMTTLTDFYLQVLLPSHVGHGSEPNYIVFDESIAVPDNGIESSLEKRKANITKQPWVTKYGYASNAPFMKEIGEYENSRQAWHYSTQSYKPRRGFVNGKTYMWEVTKVVTEDHYEPGKNEIFRGSCKNEVKVVLSGKYPPWLTVAIEEETKIIRESTHCQYIIDTYHKSTDNAKMKRCGSESDATRANSAWCGAFVAYCLSASGYKYQPDPGAIWHGKESLVKRKDGAPYETSEKWGKKYTEMYMGGIVEWHNDGHTTIIVGIDKSDPKNYILLGGNQTNGLRFWTAPKTKVHSYCIFPIDYEGDLLPLEEIEPKDLSPNATKYAEGDTE